MKHFFLNTLICLSGTLSLHAQSIELVYDAYSGMCNGEPCGIVPHDLSVMNGKLYYTGNVHPVNGEPRLWEYSGVGIPSIVSGSPNEGIGEIRAFDSLLLFTGMHNGIGEVWRLGSQSSPSVVSNLNLLYFYDADFTSYGGKVYFRALSGTSNLWAYDPVSNGTNNVAPDSSISWPTNLIRYEDTLFFKSSYSGNSVLATLSDNGLSSPRTDLNINDCTPNPAIVFNGELIFNVSDSVYGSEFWRYDGSGNPVLLHDINPGTGHAIGLQVFAEWNGKLYFVANNGLNGMELMVYAGAGVPSLVTDINPGMADAGIQFMIVYQDQLFFGATDGTNGNELWTFDGINPPTMYEDYFPGSGGSFPMEFAIFNNDLYFQATHPQFGTELHVLQGTNGVTKNEIDIVNIHPNPNSGEFYIDGLEFLQEDYQVYVMSTDGKMVKHFQNPIVNQQFSLPQKGIYFVIVQGEATRKSFKVIFE